ncbi:MAG: hypothetical protein IPI04_10385 [Ignavibacteria bacterium]|nr:hypothetical protein [Ignavibacteria bacterium]MBK7254293.1 hypothetical protein [Ignavibacteria bacterium]
MTRLLIILVLIFILLTIIKNIVKRVLKNPPVQDLKRKSETIEDNKTGSKDEDITDAKFEEIK